MAKLVLSMDGLVLREVDLSGEMTRIGRRAVNDIQLDNLSVSGEHCVISVFGGDAFLEDLNSTNGTLLNGAAVVKQRLKDGDVIHLAKYKIKFVKELVDPGITPALEVLSFDRAMSDRQADFSDPMDAEQPASTVKISGLFDWSPVPEARQLLMLVQDGSQAGQQLCLSEAINVLGRPGSARVVCELVEDGWQVQVVTEHKSVRLNVKALKAPRILHVNDVLEIEAIKLLILHTGDD